MLPTVLGSFYGFNVFFYVFVGHYEVIRVFYIISEITLYDHIFIMKFIYMVVPYVALMYSNHLKTYSNHIIYRFHMFFCVFVGPCENIRVFYIISEIKMKDHIFTQFN